MATKIVVKSFNSIPSTGSRGDILILKDGHRSGKFIYKGYGKDNNGTIKNGWHRVFTGRVDIRWFGIKSNIKKDYSRILTIVFNSFKLVKIPKGIYYSKEIIIDQEVDIKGNGTLKLISKTPNVVNQQYPFIKINSSLKIEGVTIDGNNKTAHGVEINSKNVLINRVVVKNIYSGSKGATAIGISTYNGKVKIINSYIFNIYAESNNIIGDSSGCSRAIMVGEYNSKNIADLTLIENCVFDSILGEEGDCIHSEAESVDVIKSLKINRCKFINFSRRAIKISTSNASITNCDINNQKWYQNLHCAISAFGNNIKIENNSINIKYARAFELGLEGNSTPKNYVIKKNNIKAHISKINHSSFPILLLNITNAIIEKNVIYRAHNESSAVTISGCRNVKIINNIFFGGNIAAVFMCDCQERKNINILVKNNLYKDSNSKYFLVAENTINSKFEYNHIESSNTNTKLYRIDSSSKNITIK